MKRRRLLLLGLFFTLFTSLAGCGKKDDLQTMNYFYEENPDNFNYLNNESTKNSYFFSNCLEGLMENDSSGNIKGGMASSWEVSADGKRYTFNIRPKVPWVKADGTVYQAKSKKQYVKPSDFVTGLKVAIQKKHELLYLLNKSITGLEDYITKKDRDFSHVGLKADDAKGTLTIDLNEPEPYFLSKTLHTPLFPVNEQFYQEKKKQFGKLNPENILYNGPFTIKEFAAGDKIKLQANPQYYDQKHVHLKTINLSYLSSSKDKSKYEKFAKGETAICLFSPNDHGYAEARKEQSANLLLDLPKSSTNFLTFNLNRTSFKFTTVDKDAKSTQKAKLNHQFRQAISLALDKASYNAPSVGSKAGLAEVRNSLNQPNLVQISGKNYGELLQDNLQELDGDYWKDIVVDKDGSNSSFQISHARELMSQAKSELSKQGVSFPVHLDYLEEADSARRIKRAQVLKKNLEKILGQDNIIIDIQKQSRDKVMAATYFGTTPEAMDWDLWINGFSPDFSDPFSFLRNFDLRNGSYLHTLGLHPTNTRSLTINEQQVADSLGLTKYSDLLDQASQQTQQGQKSKRLKSLVTAESYLLNQNIFIPIRTDVVEIALRVKPFTWSYGSTGIMRSLSWTTPRFKYMELQKEPVKKSDYDVVKQKFEAKLPQAKMLDEKK